VPVAIRIVYVLPTLIDVATIDEGSVGDVGVKPLLSLFVLKLVATVLPALAYETTVEAKVPLIFPV
jgi:hypothetical protein